MGFEVFQPVHMQPELPATPTSSYTSEAALDRVCLVSRRRPRRHLLSGVWLRLASLLTRSTEQSTSHEVWRPSGGVSCSVRSPRVCLTRHLPPMGFLSPSTVCSAASELVVFHTSTTCGIRGCMPALPPQTSRVLPPRASELKS